MQTSHQTQSHVERWRELGDRLTGGGLRALARRLVVGGFRTAIRVVDPEEIERARKAQDEVLKAKIIASEANAEREIRRQAPGPSELPSLFGCQTMGRKGRIAVVLHLYYTELWPEFERAILSISEPFDLFVTLTSQDEKIETEIRDQFAGAQILHFENRGRDILPFVALINSGVLFNYQLVCKVHSKRSLQRSDGDRWRRILVEGILGEEDLVRRITRVFDSDPDLGVVVADGQLYGLDPSHWAGNLDIMRSHASKIGLYELPPDITFPAGSMYWIRPFLLRQIAALKLGPDDFESEPVPEDGTTAHAVERFVGLICRDAGMRIAESSELPEIKFRPRENLSSLIAFYLPQFHPIPENDLWWGTGFTEWSNVSRAVPMFRGHRQPRIPTDLGFYDLRLAEVRAAQADLAKQHGIDAFCYYYYWFNGRRLLSRPLDEVVQTGSPNFPFLICWANESWTRNWDGGNREVLVAQTYEEGWPEAFARDIVPILKDRRYFHVNGRPLLLIYRVTNIPDCANALSNLRTTLEKSGIGEVCILAGWFDIQGDEALPDDPRELGIDKYYEFPPHGLTFAEITDSILSRDLNFRGNIHSYESAIARALDKLKASSKTLRYPGVMVGWDNTPRRMQNGHIVQGSTPAKFRRWLRQVVQHEAKRKGNEERLIFINAWNEWAEGAYLEPDRDWGHGYLEAVASAVGIKPERGRETAKG